MKLPRDLSGVDVVKVLKKHYGWEIYSREGSHVTLKNVKEKVILTVPLHKQLDVGTVLAILRKANIEKGDFIEKL